MASRNASFLREKTALLQGVVSVKRTVIFLTVYLHSTARTLSFLYARPRTFSPSGASAAWN